MVLLVMQQADEEREREEKRALWPSPRATPPHPGVQRGEEGVRGGAVGSLVLRRWDRATESPVEPQAHLSTLLSKGHR